MFGDHLKSLHLNVVSLLYRLPYEVGLLDSPCYRCGKHLSDIDGLPLNASGWIPPSPRKAGDKVANGKADDAMDVDEEEKENAKGEDKEGKEKDEEKKGDEKDDDKEKEKGDAKEGEKDAKAAEAEEAKDGRWVAWHASCRPS